MISLSKQGLQNSLDRLGNYCKENRLTLNISKTKSIIFNNSGKLINQNFFINNAKIEAVQTFCYLGFDLKASGILSQGIKTLHDKANKAMRPLKGVISRFNIPVKTALKLFHTYIEPIALYTSECWSVLSD